MRASLASARKAGRPIARRSPPFPTCQRTRERSPQLSLIRHGITDEGDRDQLGRARPDFATMGMEELLALPVDRFADAAGCHFYLWATNRSLPKGFALIERWGFRYVTTLTWAKPTCGLGNYFRGQTEHVLFGVCGSLPLKCRDVGTVFHVPCDPASIAANPPNSSILSRRATPTPILNCRTMRAARLGSRAKEGAHRAEQLG